MSVSNGKNKFLKIAHVNVESLIAHKDNFMSYFSDNFYDIIAVTETFLKPEILDSIRTGGFPITEVPGGISHLVYR